MKITKKPVTVDAIRFDGDPIEVQDWLNDLWEEYGEPDIGDNFGMEYHQGTGMGDGDYIVIRTLEGPLSVAVGAWIVRGVQGEFYPIKDSIIRATYELPDGIR